jgi:hypothetical protein
MPAREVLHRLSVKFRDVRGIARRADVLLRVPPDFGAEIFFTMESFKGRRNAACVRVLSDFEYRVRGKIGNYRMSIH